MDKLSSSHSITNEQTVRGRHVKETHTTRRDTTPESTMTQSGHSSRLMKWLTMGFALSSPFSTASAQEIDVPTAPNMRAGHVAELSQRGALYHPLESTGITSSSDSLRQHKNMGQDKFPPLRGGNVELPQPTANDVKHRQRDKKFEKEIRFVLSACRDPEFVEKVVALVDKRVAMGISPMILDERFVKYLSKRCQKRNFKNALDHLTENERIMSSFGSLLNVKDVESPQHNVEAIQEETGAHHLDTTQEDTQKQKRPARKLLSEEVTYEKRRWGKKSPSERIEMPQDEEDWRKYPQHPPNEADSRRTENELAYRTLKDQLDRYETRQDYYLSLREKEINECRKELSTFRTTTYTITAIAVIIAVVMFVRSQNQKQHKDKKIEELNKLIEYMKERERNQGRMPYS